MTDPLAMKTNGVGEEQMRQHLAWKAARMRLSQPTVKFRELPPPAPVRRPNRKRDWLVLIDGEVPLARGPSPTAAPWQRIAWEVALAHGVSFKEMISYRRTDVLVHARQEAWWRIKNATALNSSDLARRFNRDHTTILHGIRKHEERMRAVAE